MYARMNMLAGDPAQLSEATRYLEGTVRPHVEGQHGNRGLACLVNADTGVCVVASYWDSPDAMTASEQAVQVSRKEVAERLRASVTVEHYDVPVFVRRSRPPEGAGVRIVQEGPTLVLVLDAHDAHPEPFTAEELLPYWPAEEPPEQQQAMQRRKIMRRARSKKLRPPLLTELESRYGAAV